MIRRGLLCFLFPIVVASRSAAQCVAADPTIPPLPGSSELLVVGTGWPASSDPASILAAAAQMWSNAGCDPGGTSFPKLVTGTAPFDGTVIPVNYAAQAPQDNANRGVCGVTDHLKGTITLYGSTSSGSRGQAAPPSPPSIPEVMVLRPGEAPAWVDAARVLTASGEIDTKVVAPANVNHLRQLLDSPETSGCVTAGPVTFDELVLLGQTPPKARSLSDALRASELTLVGVVTNRSYGFAGQFAGQLVQIRPEAVVKDSQGRQEYYYLFIPVGTFKVGNTTVCATDPREAVPPEVGEHIALVLRATTRGQSNFIHPIEPSYITIKRDGTLVAPDNLKPGLPATKRELLRVVGASAPGGGR